MYICDQLDSRNVDNKFITALTKFQKLKSLGLCKGALK